MATQRRDLMLVNTFHKAAIELGLNTIRSVLLHTINALSNINGDDV